MNLLLRCGNYAPVAVSEMSAGAVTIEYNDPLLLFSVAYPGKPTIKASSIGRDGPEWLPDTVKKIILGGAFKGLLSGTAPTKNPKSRFCRIYYT